MYTSCFLRASLAFFLLFFSCSHSRRRRSSSVSSCIFSELLFDFRISGLGRDFRLDFISIRLSDEWARPRSSFVSLELEYQLVGREERPGDVDLSRRLLRFVELLGREPKLKPDPDLKGGDAKGGESVLSEYLFRWYPGLLNAGTNVDDAGAATAAILAVFARRAPNTPAPDRAAFGLSSRISSMTRETEWISDEVDFVLCLWLNSEAPADVGGGVEVDGGFVDGGEVECFLRQGDLDLRLRFDRPRSSSRSSVFSGDGGRVDDGVEAADVVALSNGCGVLWYSASNDESTDVPPGRCGIPA